LRQQMRGYYAAPLHAPQSILDVGCGTGIWPKEMADIFPNATVIGCDLLTPPSDDPSLTGGIQIAPPNYTFKAANVLEGLPFGDRSFDFVHQRLLNSAIPTMQWSRVANELARVTRPGGWIELVECDVAQGNGPGLEAIKQWILAFCDRRGLNPARQPSEYVAFLHNAGLTNIVARRIDLPVGSAKGRNGQLAEADFNALVTTFRPALIASGLATEAEYDAAVSAMKDELAQRGTIWPFYIVYGQLG